MPRIEVIPPIVHREFLVRSRARSTYRLRVWTAGAAFVLLAIAIILPRLPIPGTPPPGLQNGASFFVFTSWCLWIFCLAEGLRQSFDALSREKREGTIGLLFPTRMRRFDVVLGKVSAGFIASFFPILAALPIVGTFILLGGVTGAEFVRVSVSLLATLGLSLSVGIFISAWSVHAGRSLIVAIGVLLLWMLAAILTSGGSALAIPSPWTLLLNSFESRYWMPAYWLSLGTVLGMSLLFFIGAGLVISRQWRVTVSRHSFCKSAAAASAPRKQGRAERELLEQRPIAWLATRSNWRWLESRQVKLLSLLLLLALAFVFPSMGQWLMIFAATVSLFCIAVWQGICLFLEAQRSGWLELLLTTPVSARSIIAQLEYLTRRLALQGTILLAVLGLVAVANADSLEILRGKILFSSPTLFISNAHVFNLFADPGFDEVLLLVFHGVMWVLTSISAYCWLYGIYWYGLWRGLAAKSLANALGRTLLVTVVVYHIVMFFLLVAFSRVLSISIISALTTIAFFFWLGRRARRRLSVELSGIRTGSRQMPHDIV